MAYRYIGNKTRLVPELLERVRGIAPPGGVVADLMCGTASVSAGLRSEGFTVVAADTMTYAVHHARVRLLLSRSPAFRRLGCRSYGEVLDELQHLKPREGYFVREFSPAGKPSAGCRPRKYFTEANAAHIDAIRTRIAWWQGRGALTEREHSLLSHDLIMAVNDVANIAGTYGHYRSMWSESALRPLRLDRTRFEKSPTVNHSVHQGRAEDVAPLISADLCYLDPPYMKRQYAANYHLVETLARGDEPEAIGESGLRNWWDQYSNFCSKRRIGDAFAAVLGKMDCPYFLISYSEDGLMSLDQLVSLFREFGVVTVETIRNTRFRSNGSPLGRHVTEYLFHVDTH
jgi:adenine-specific DNA-methyltransferase